MQSHPIDDEFRPQTLPAQLIGIWRRVGIADHKRLAVAVIGWASVSALVSAVIFLWQWISGNGWFPGAVNAIPWWSISLLYLIQEGLNWLGSLHLILWSQWRWPTRPSIKRLIGLGLLMSVVSILIWYPLLLGSGRFKFLLITWLNFAITFVWYVLAVRSLSPFAEFRITVPESETNDRSPKRGWSLRGLFLATFLVAVTIVVKRWVGWLRGDMSQVIPGVNWMAFDLINSGFVVAHTILLTYAAANLVVERRFRSAAILVAISGIVTVVCSIVVSLMLPSSVLQSSSHLAFFFWLARVVVLIGMHLIAFRLWQWAGYQVRATPHREPRQTQPITREPPIP